MMRMSVMKKEDENDGMIEKKGDEKALERRKDGTFYVYG